jgi:hypothetical protein
MEIATFNARCRRFHKFQVPLFSDMSYGKFLFSDNFGQNYKYYIGLDDPNCKLIEEILENEFKLSDAGLGDRIREIIGLICDKEPSIKFYTDQIICPKCQSKLLNLNRNERIGWIRIDKLTFLRFNKQPRLDKTREIKKIIEAWR